MHYARDQQVIASSLILIGTYILLGLAMGLFLRLFKIGFNNRSRVVLLVCCIAAGLIAGCSSKAERSDRPDVVGSFGRTGRGAGEFLYPRAIELLSNGEIIVLDKAGSAKAPTAGIAKFTSISASQLHELLTPKFMNRLDALDVLSRKILQGKIQGERRSKRRGHSVEFADHRPYVVGDDLRFIDWNIFGRLEQLFLKLFLEELDLTLHVTLDISGSMGTGEPRKNLYAKQLAAALTYIGLVNNNRVTLSVFDDGLRARLANMRGRSYLPQMAEFLLDAKPEGVSNFTKTCEQLTTGPSGRGVVIVISDFLMKEGYAAGLRRLVGGQAEVYAILLLSPQELSPEISGDLKLIDVEDGDSSEVTVSGALLKYYKQNLRAYCDELQNFCTKLGAYCMLGSTAEPVETVVLTHLRKLGLLN